MYEYLPAPVSKLAAGPGGEFSRPRRMDEPLAGQSDIPRQDEATEASSSKRTTCSTRILGPSIRAFMLCLGAMLTLATRTATAHPTSPIPMASNTLNLSPILYTPSVHNLDTLMKLDPDFPAVLLDYEPPHDHFSNHQIGKRQDDEAPPISTGKASTKTSAHASTLTAPTRTATTVTVKSSTTATATSLSEDADFALPTPFEAMGNNFTTNSCPDFIKNMVQADEFKACLPFSTFLETSTSFFQMEKSPFQTTAFLDRSCAANTTYCADYLTTLATILILPENCKPDYDELDPIVQQAHNALLAYLPLYSASCLRNDAGTGYCFVDMISNASAWMDPSIYSLGIGKELVPGGANATATSKAGQADGGTLPLSCGSCLKRVMGVLNSAANSGQKNAPVRAVWAEGAKAVNDVCGTGFANETVVDLAFTGSAERRNRAALVPLVVAVVAAIVLF